MGVGGFSGEGWTPKMDFHAFALEVSSKSKRRISFHDIVVGVDFVILVNAPKFVLEMSREVLFKSKRNLRFLFQSRCQTCDF
jgi:hypothetical protein